MKIRVFPVAQLSADHLAAWSRLQQSDAALANPFFRPEFSQAMAAVRSDVKVVVWEQAHEVVGFLPFEQSRWRVGKPVGSHINEFQGAIARTDVAWSPQEVVRASGLRAWRFDHLATTQNAFGPYQCVVSKSPYIDISQGSEHFLNSRNHRWLTKLGQKTRKATRELGEVRFEINSTDRHALMKLLEWNVDQCRRTHRPYTFSCNWVVRSFERLLDHASDEFAGMLFSLYFGERLAAVELNIRSGSTMHRLVVGYDRNLRQYAPGLRLTMHVVQAASKLGITRIDLGKGGEEYKADIATDNDFVAEGTVHSQPLQKPFYRAWIHTKHRLRGTRVQTTMWRLRRWMGETGSV